MTSRLRDALVSLALVMGVLLVYWPVRAHAFVNYDDHAYVLENPHVAGGLSWTEIRWVFSHGYAGNYHPLTWLSHMLDVELFGLDAGLHHLSSALLHALNAVLCFRALRALSGRAWSSALAAALFALHPLRVESVAWASERKDLLCATFVFLTLWAYASHAHGPSTARYLLVCALLALALLAKPMAVTVPFMLLLLDWWPLGVSPGPQSGSKGSSGSLRRGSPDARAARRWPKPGSAKLFLEKLPLLLLASLGALTTVLAQRKAGATSDLSSLPLDLRALNALSACGVYLWQSVWPARLAVFYPHAAIVAAEPVRALIGPALSSAALLGLAGAAALRWRRTRPYLLVGWLWFLVMLLPAIGLVQVGVQAHADRYTYLPLVGVAWMVALLAGDLWERRPGLRAALVSAGCLLPLACALTSARQVRVWKDSETLFEHALAVTDRNYLAHIQLGRLARSSGDTARAEEELRRALSIHPRSAAALNELALVQRDRGQPARARELLQRAVAIAPGDPELLLNLGVAELESGDLRAARAQLEACLGIAPDEPDAHFDLGLVAQREGKAAEAEARFRAALALDPAHGDALNNLGQVLLAAGRAAEAVEVFERLAALEPGDPGARFNLAVALERAGARARAAESYRRSIALDPAFEPARAALERLERAD